MPSESLTDGITPEMIRLGLICRDLCDLGTMAHRIESDLGRLLDEMAPDYTPGEPIADHADADAWLDRFTALVDEAEQARKEGSNAF